LHRADEITTICEGLRTDVMGRGVSGERITVIPNSVDAEGFAARAPSGVDMRARFGLEGKCVLGFIGSFFAWEGLVLLIESLPLVLERNPDVRLLLVGGGPEEGAMRVAVARHGVGERVIFAGQVPHTNVSALYDAVDVLAYPRLPMRLTNMVTPLKPLEAMAMQKVFVASDVGGHKELVDDGVTGVLFRAGDRTALADAILRVAADADLRGRLVANGLKFVREERTWTRAVRGYGPVYARVLGRDAAQTSYG
jgi:glycosyltransferase involved in cell wall biosynthesis